MGSNMLPLQTEDKIHTSRTRSTQLYSWSTLKAATVKSPLGGRGYFRDKSAGTMSSKMYLCTSGGVLQSDNKSSIKLNDLYDKLCLVRISPPFS